MPVNDPEKAFRQDYEAHKDTRRAQTRQLSAFKNPVPSQKTQMEAELKRLRARVVQLERQHLIARQAAAAALGQANRMSQVPVHVMKTTLNDIMKALDAKPPKASPR